jgi:hypothetical protein
MLLYVHQGECMLCRRALEVEVVIIKGRYKVVLSSSILIPFLPSIILSLEILLPKLPTALFKFPI